MGQAASDIVSGAMSIGPADQDEKIETCVADDCRRVEVVTGVDKDSSEFAGPITPAIVFAAVKTLVAVAGLLIPWIGVPRRHCIACGAVLPQVMNEAPPCLVVDFQQVEAAGDFAITKIFLVAVFDPDRPCNLPRRQQRRGGDVPH